MTIKGLQNLFAVSTLCGLGLLANNTLAALIYSEPFDYGSIDTPLAGKNGGLGFSGTWAEQNPGIVYKTASLSFSDLPVSGGSAYATGTDGIGSALLYRPLAAPLNGQVGLPEPLAAATRRAHADHPRRRAKG